jgi:hypothetical protein
VDVGGIRGLVTRVSHQPNGSHWVTAEKDPGADCCTRAKRRGDLCAKWSLQILDDTVVLRGQGEDARPASPSDVEEGQTVLAFPGDSAEFESYPPTAGADKVVILGPGVSGTRGAGTAGRAGASGGGPEAFLARQLPGGDFATALTRGELVLDGRGCLALDDRPAPPLVPVWPSGFEARVEGGEVRVVNGAGKTVSRVGEGIVAGGGEVPSLDDLGAVQKEQAREIQERCPSKSYWLVGGGVRVTTRGDPRFRDPPARSSENAPSAHSGE